MSFLAWERALGDGVEDSSEPVMVATKLRPPSVRYQIVPRERLMERLRAGSGRRLSLVACPAGFGKTTLLAAWHEAEAACKPMAWLTLDEGDDDPVALWSYVVEALRRVCPAIGQSASPRAAGSAHIVDIVLPHLVNELNDQHGVTLILDDFHRLSAGAARESIAWFVDHAPRTLQLVLSTRTEPGFPPLIERGVAFLYSGGQATEVAVALLHQGSVLRALGVGERSQAAMTEARAVIGSCPDPGILTGWLGRRTRGQMRPNARQADRAGTRGAAVR